MSEKGKTSEFDRCSKQEPGGWDADTLTSALPSEPLGGVKNLKVVDPTISTLTVRWDPAVGDVRTYKVFYAAQPGGEEKMVKTSFPLVLKGNR